MFVITNEPKHIFLFHITQGQDMSNLSPSFQIKFRIPSPLQNAFLLQVTKNIVNFLSIIY